MKKIIILFFAGLFAFKLSVSQIVSFDFNTDPYLNATFFDSHCTVSSFQVSSGTISTNRTTSPFPDLPYMESSSGWAATSVFTAKYFYLTITANQGYWFSLQSISFETIVTSAGPSDISMVVNDSVVFTGAAPLVVDTLQQSLSGFDSLTSATIKLAGWDNGSRVTSGAGAFRIDQFVIDGVFSAIPPKDSTSSVILGSFSVPVIISSLQNKANPIKVCEFVFTDSASGDGVSTLIDSLKIIPADHNQFFDWDLLLDEVILKGPDFTEGIQGRIDGATLVFETNNVLQVAEGTAQSETYELWVALKKELSQADNQGLGFELPISNIYCDSRGSQVNRGGCSTEPGTLTIEVKGTQVHAIFPDDVLYADSVFQIIATVTDVNGNRDMDDGSLVILSASSDQAHLTSGTSLNGDFESGIITFDHLQFSGTDTAVFQLFAEDYGTFLSEPVLVGFPYFTDHFESGNLNPWLYSEDWQCSELNPIDEYFSLQHNLLGAEGTSYITSQYPEPKMNDGKMVWRMLLKNGDFDPTSSNRFWYFLMASDSNLLSTETYGYAVGVNLTGSSDTLSLWKVSEDGNKELIAQSDFDWNTNHTVAMEVIREVPGIWTLGCSEGSVFDSVQYATEAAESSFCDLPFHGLVFQFSSTRGGQLWADGFDFFQLNSPPVLLAAEATDNKIVQLTFSEAINDKEPMTTGNFQISSPPDFGITLDSVSLNQENKKQVLLYVNQLMTAEYQVAVHGLSDDAEQMMIPQSVAFNYRVPAIWGDVVINEIMFDPSPVVGLPEYDYLELYNQGENPFYLDNWQLEIDGVSKTFPDSVLEKGGYLILTSQSAVAPFQTYGKTLPMISTTTLTNSGKTVLLYSPEGNLIDSVYYQPLWITDEGKQDGGWSLERIDPENDCSASGNWNASVDTSGGTPGRQNSIFGSNIDATPPILSSWAMVSDTELYFSFNEEITSHNQNPLEFWNFTPTISGFDTLIVSENRREFHLIFSEALTPDTHYQCLINGIFDLCDNQINDTTISILYHIPQLHDLVFNEIMADPSPVVGLPESDYVELYNRSGYSISLQGWELWSGTTRKVLPVFELDADEYLLICQTVFEGSYHESIVQMPILSSTFLPSAGKPLVLRSPDGLTIDSVLYSLTWYQDEEKEAGGWSLERMDVTNFCSTLFNWKASMDETGGTPGRINSIARPNQDTLVPQIRSLQISSSRSVTLDLSESIPEESFSHMENFTLSLGFGQPDSVKQFIEEGFTLELFFTDPFEPTKTYRLHVAGLADNCGNLMKDTLLSFFYYLPQANDIIINEIMADPTPSTGLPEVTYLELYNRSPWPIDVQNWKLIYSGYSRLLQSFVIQPGRYLLLCPAGEAEALTPFGDVMDVLSSTTLTSSGKFLQLQDSSGAIITSVDYRKSWYGNANKEDGGWALERIDPENLCSGSFNWSASNSAKGGTPGQLNSVNAQNLDQSKPKVSYVKIVDAQRLNIEFSEPITAQQLSDSQHYIIHGTSLSVASVDAELYSVIVKHATPFIEGNHYTLKITGIPDECSNVMNDTLITFKFNAIEPNDVVFTELMVDETPPAGLPGYEYVELYNRSNKIIELEGWKLVLGGNQKVIPRKKLLPDSYIILCSESGAEDLTAFGEVLAVTGFPSLPNDYGALQLLDTTDNVINQVAYSANWYQAPEKDNGGYSLEIIDPNNNCGQFYNWKASVSDLGGTPGTINSVNAQNIDQLPPSIKNLIPVAANEVWVEFSETTDSGSKLDKLNYQLMGFGNPTNIIADSLDGSRVLLRFTSNMESPSDQQLQIKNVADFCGNLMLDSTIGFTYYKPKLYDVVVNEIMATPEPSSGLPGKEYMELFNNTAYDLHLYQWNLTVGSSVRQLPYVSVPPNSYLILTQTGNDSAFQPFGPVLEVENLPSLAASGNAYLYQPDGSFMSGTVWSSTWFADEFKANGGFSLERVDTRNPDETPENWSESQSPVGGTPGQPNSVYKSNPDNLPPDLVRAYPMSDTVIRIEFSEAIQMESLKVEQFTLDGAQGIFKEMILYLPNLWYSDWKLHSPLKTGTTYQLQANETITDIAGNPLQKKDARFALASKAAKGGVVINELLYNPTSTGTDFVELYNRGNFPVNLKQFLLATRDADGNLDQLKTVSGFGTILFPSEYVVLSPDQELVKNNYLTKNEQAFYDMASLPSFPDDKGIVVLLDTSGIVIDEFAYTDGMQFALLQTTEGVSLERIHFDRHASETSNWHSASETVGWATPGYENSVFMEWVATSDEITVEPELFSPNNDGYNDVVNFRYQFEKAGFVANVTIFNEKGMLIRKVVQNELLAAHGTFSWDGLMDDLSKAPAGIYIVYFEIFDLDGNSKQFKKVCASSMNN
jgi:hypothetical protein